jgi:hypothetical protein
MGTFALVFLFDTRVDDDTLETKPLAASSVRLAASAGMRARRWTNQAQNPGEAGLR